MKIPKYIQNKIIKARDLMFKVEELKYDIHQWMIDNDLENVEIDADNCSNLAEAIECFIDYGEQIDNSILIALEVA
mgnify:CR=1 FL=1